MVQAPRLLCLLFFTSVTIASVAPAASPERIPLWKDGAPGSVARMNEPEKVDGSNVTNVHHPSITAYLPTAESSTGTAVIIAPGGGHRMLCLGHEGDALAEWFAEHGIAAFVLRYRLSREPDSIYTLQGHAMDDTRRAIRMVRLNASEWNINPERIGILGFSAGGELAAYSAMESDSGDSTSSDPIEQQSSRPDFQGLIYPGKSGTFTVHKGMPPAFVAYGYNDRPDISIGMAEVYLKYKKAGVPCEMHVYANAGHGFGYHAGSTSAAGDWPQRFVEWLRDSKLLSSK
ncbi:alpha/beta hydrolase [Stieleria sp. JC731]|uniref:alpha/beta hydrolase n=1 Tax=Pirellulaceae TaxID=2691357 RepID=UPI001E2D2599|nr:alpha/beta hydrolase [Stieleria sp. JC731]MCC9599120.1 alpha/beta hydrolase [Stieleria sp. JC731]